MYGGRGANDQFVDDIWVLSLPGFVWTLVYQGTSPRAGHSCHRVNSRTMISVGGTSNTDYGSPPCDWQTMGLGVLEISDLTWGSVYNATQGEYEVPAKVVASIGGRHVHARFTMIFLRLVRITFLQSLRQCHYESTSGRFLSKWARRSIQNQSYSTLDHPARLRPGPTQEGPCHIYCWRVVGRCRMPRLLCFFGLLFPT